MLNYLLFNYVLPLLSFTKKSYLLATNYYNTITKILNSNEIVFFENNSNAYLSSFINSLHTCSGVITWRFNIYNNVFYSYSCVYKDTKHFPILSASLICDSEKINLDDFFEELKVHTSNLGFPSVQQVMEVYTYKSGIVFDRTKPWKLNMLDTNVNEYTLDIFKDSWPFTENTKN